MNNKIGDSVNNVDKVKRYGWVIKDDPGELKRLHKKDLRIHPAYQRDLLQLKVLEIASTWSWVGCGAIVVGDRGGDLWVIDGQHRVMAAMKRSDINELPCIVFKTESVKQEAGAFLDLNAGRKPVSSLGKFKAMIAAGDKAACDVHLMLERLGISTKSMASKPKEIKSVAWLIRKAKEDTFKLEVILTLTDKLCPDIPLQERLLDGLWYINENLPGGVSDKRFIERAYAVGGRKLLDAANRASAYFAKGGARVWANGMIEELNKGLRYKFVLRDQGHLTKS